MSNKGNSDGPSQTKSAFSRRGILLAGTSLAAAAALDPARAPGARHGPRGAANSGP
jgi:hypothetical protein